ncbi:MAG: CsbD family protein [Pseudomonadota bacterium]
MNKHQVEGRVNQGIGKVKEVAGKAVDNDRLQSEGLADQAKGKLQTGYGDAKENIKDKARDFIKRI